MADHMTLSHWFIYILSQRLVAGSVITGCDNAVFANFVAAISRTNSNWFEFVWLIAATKFCRSDNDFHKINHVTQGELLRQLVHATCRSVAATYRLVCPGYPGLYRSQASLLIISWRDRSIVINNSTARKTWAIWTKKKKDCKIL